MQVHDVRRLLRAADCLSLVALFLICPVAWDSNGTRVLWGVSLPFVGSEQMQVFLLYQRSRAQLRVGFVQGVSKAV
ncbi:hypothetical protein GE09DRAFT_1151296 [Coniochaeta sp. 2T2.1]|nr:hypothetical protein GE09DRAFT_1151296 [Coniochaeta sp. 2T2.1]